MINRRGFFKTAGGVGAALALGVSASPVLAAAHGKKGTGTFEGRSNHETSGSVRVIEEDGRTFVELGEDFSLDGGPDPRVGFGNDGTYDGENGYLAALLSLNGKQRYAVPSTMDVSAFNEVYIWCDVASVPLGVASLHP
ncbi:DM13 domain-containing protein [Roseovarius aestuarii]|uniref:Electron transfer DM13 n=1 Tax=Roseovarius aestuarii TaxID=475083 RepID=A0A1X7BQS0_9RHOB|nr:DM13 domain-containing protein [Roseovarius aestuarii]SMC12026.1 Electron transfer DM13 [Roseovarius aestuarii]